MSGKLTLGPLLFHWSADKRRDFYAQIADEAPVDTVHLGEVVCSKRAPFFDPHIPETAERLMRAGKEVVLSTLALVASEREIDSLRQLVGSDLLIEANDLAAVRHLAGKPHALGPYLSIFNEGTLTYLASRGAVRACLPVETTEKTITALAQACPNMELECLAFGRLPLTVSARCYHARSKGLSKDSCQYVCGEDADGKMVETLDGDSFVCVNGTQTASHGYANLLSRLDRLKAAGVKRFRLSPQDVDMVAAVRVFRDRLDGKMNEDQAQAALDDICDGIAFVDGFMAGREGYLWSENAVE